MEGRFIDCKKALIPCDANKNKTIECDTTTINAATGDIFNKSLPTVYITFFEYVKTPTAIAKPPSKNNCSFEEKINQGRLDALKYGVQ